MPLYVTLVAHRRLASCIANSSQAAPSLFPTAWTKQSRLRHDAPQHDEEHIHAVRATDIPSRLTALRFLQCKERIHLIKLSNISSFSFRAGLAARCSTPTRRPKHGQLWRLFVGRTVSCHAVTNPTHAAHCSCGRETARGSHRLHHPPTRLYLASEPSPVCHTPPFLHTHTHTLSLSLSLSLSPSHTHLTRLP